MAGQVEARLADLGIEVPEAAAPVANYVGFVQTGKLVFISGQVPLKDGKFQYQGKLGENMSLDRRFHGPAQGRQRCLGFHGRGLRRQGTPFPRRGLRCRPARRRGGRGRSRDRDRLTPLSPKGRRSQSLDRDRDLLDE